MRFFKFSFFLMVFTCSHADEADRIGREYAWKTFKMKFPAEYSAEYCSATKHSVFQDWMILIENYVVNELVDVSTFKKLDRDFQQIRKPIERCQEYLRFTNQSDLFVDKSNKNQYEVALKNVQLDLMQTRIAWNDNFSLEGMKYFTGELKAQLSIFRLFLEKHNKNSQQDATKDAAPLL